MQTKKRTDINKRKENTKKFPLGGIDVCICECFCMKEEISATGRSLVQRKSSTVYGVIN
jgi:hypothetical protein